MNSKSAASAWATRSKPPHSAISASIDSWGDRPLATSLLLGIGPVL